MAWTELITLLALLEYLVFAMLVGKARGQYGVKAPAVTGHEMFERAYRVQMNTLELLVIFLPALWLASQHFSSTWTAPLGGLFLVGRIVYARAYVSDPAKRSAGFGLSILPTLVLLVMGFMGALKLV
jgi:glutathione S-transferase